MRQTFVIWATLERGGIAVLQANYSEFVTREQMLKRAEGYRDKYPDAKLVTYVEIDVVDMPVVEEKPSGSLKDTLYSRPGRFIAVDGDPSAMDAETLRRATDGHSSVGPRSRT